MKAKAGRADHGISQKLSSEAQKLGEMLIVAKAAGQITKANKRHHVDGGDMMKVTLSDVGISRDLSSRADPN